MFVDSHCHLDRISENEQDLLRIVADAEKARVEHMLCVAVSVKEFDQMYSRVKGFEQVSVSCGVHPLHQDDACEKSLLLSKCALPQVIAIGETGLDYFYSADNKEIQKRSFIDHIEVANSLDKPLIIHTRGAQTDTLEILNQYYQASTGAVLHCFTESLAMARAAIDMGIYISISGIVTFKSAAELQETVKQLPLDKLLIETDSPWLAPVPFRGKTNEPKHVVEVAQFIADLKNISIEELAEVTKANFYQLFKRASVK